MRRSDFATALPAAPSRALTGVCLARGSVGLCTTRGRGASGVRAVDRITGLTVGFRASTGFSDLAWRGFGGSARDGDRFTPRLGAVALVSEALDFGAGGFCFDVCDAGFGAAFGLAAGFDAA